MIPVLPILSLLSGWQKYLVIGLVALAAAATVWMHGYFKGKQALYEYQAEQAREAVRIITKRGEVTERVVTKWRTVDRVVEKQGEVIIREVPVYVTASDDAACSIPDGFISLWNGANTGKLPPSPGRVNDGPARTGGVLP